MKTRRAVHTIHIGQRHTAKLQLRSPSRQSLRSAGGAQKAKGTLGPKLHIGHHGLSNVLQNKPLNNRTVLKASDKGHKKSILDNKTRVPYYKVRIIYKVRRQTCRFPP